MAVIPKPKGSSTRRAYVTNTELLSEIRLSKEQGRISERLATMWMLMCKRLASKACFSSYSYKDDMISDALTNLCRGGLQFDETRSSNPFSFYTTTILRCFYGYLNREKRQRNIRDELLIESGQSASFTFNEDGRGSDDFSYDDSGVLYFNPQPKEAPKPKSKGGRPPILREEFLSY